MLSDKNIIPENGRFYWYDEHGLERYGPYDTLQEAKDSMENYARRIEEFRNAKENNDE